ncbi:MAG: hypothetical protein LBG63_01460, partial [Candidatus Methanoplasma sp.]|nr:hypothetical protein [Candidatus Methanoplasma sp.]
AYGPSMHRYSADAELEEGFIRISISSSGADTYSAVVLDNGDYSAPTQLYIYLDERYDEFVEEAEEAIGLDSLDMEYSIDQMCRLLKIRGFSSILICNDEQLRDAMAEDMKGRSSKGLLVMSYALPQNIYSGTDGCLLFEWIKSGNSLYWMSSPIGMFYHGEDGLVEVKNNQERFFGKECINMTYSDPVLSVIEAGGLTDALCLKWNRTLYGLDTSGLDGASVMGFSHEGYSSISMVPFGKGMVCVIGGKDDRYQREDAAQTIASGVSCYSNVLEIRSGSIVRETVEFSLDVPDDANDILTYISIGGVYVVYGRAVRC